MEKQIKKLSDDLADEIDERTTAIIEGLVKGFKLL